MAFSSAPLPSIGLLIEPETLPAGQFSTNRSDNASLTSTRLLAYRKVPAAYGEIELTGQDATLTEVTAQTPVYAAPLPSLSMFDLGAAGAYVMPSEAGAFSTARSDNASLTSTKLTKGLRLTASAGAFGAEGAPAERDMEMNADPRLFQVLGQAATILIGPRTLTGAYGAYSLAGQDVSFAVESTGSRTLPAEVGRFSSSRSDNPSLTATTMTRTYRLTSDYADYLLTGQSATLTGPVWQDVQEGSGSWVYVTPSGGVWTDVDPDS